MSGATTDRQAAGGEPISPCIWFDGQAYAGRADV